MKAKTNIKQCSRCLTVCTVESVLLNPSCFLSSVLNEKRVQQVFMHFHICFLYNDFDVLFSNCPPSILVYCSHKTIVHINHKTNIKTHVLCQIEKLTPFATYQDKMGNSSCHFCAHTCNLEFKKNLQFLYFNKSKMFKFIDFSLMNKQ